MLDQLLLRCGLNPSEQSVLISLLKHGASAASPLAKAVGLKRPTVYAVLENLVSAGLVMKEKRRSGTVFRALSRTSIPRLLEKNAKVQFESVREAASLLDEQLKELPTLERLNFGGFELSSIESSTAVYAHLEEVLAKGNFSAIFNPQLIPKEQLETTVKQFLERAAVTQPNIREIAISGPAARWYRKNIRNKNHQFKEIPAERAVFSDVILVAGEVVISNYQVNSELAVRMKEPNLFRTLMTVFDMLWESLG